MYKFIMKFSNAVFMKEEHFNMIRFIKENLILFIVFLSTCLVWIPLIMIISGSFMGAVEINDNVGTIFNDSHTFVKWNVIPQYPTLKPYIELLLDTPQFFVMFWNSCKQVFPILLGQLVIAVPAAWSFAHFNFKYKKAVFALYIILMILPFQVTMVSSYLILNKLQLMDTHWALIIPNIFSTLPVFIMAKFFKGIPSSLIEAAKVDGASEFIIFVKIAVPLGKPGILSALVLGFLEYWNNIEQPLTFLKDKSLWPLSLYLSDIASDNLGVSLAASVIMLMPALLIFLAGQKYLEQGIIASGMKD